MSDLEWSFDISGNAKAALEDVDAVLASLSKPLESAEAGLKKLERALAAQAISKINDPLKQNTALMRLHVQGLREEKDAQEKINATNAKAAESWLKVYNAEKKAHEEHAKKVATKVSEDNRAQAGGAATGVLGALGLGDLAKLTTVAGAAELAAEAVVGLTKMLASLGTSFIKLGIDSAEGKKAMLGALDTFEEGRTSKIFGILQNMGIAAGISADKTVAAYADLRAAGFKAKEAQDVVAASFDVAAQKGGGAAGAAAADKFTDVFTKLRALGKVGSRDLLTIARDLGISTDSLTDAMAKRMHTSADQARKTLADGKADATIVQNALLDVVQTKFDKGGPLGTKAKELAGSTITAPLQSLKDLVANLFEDVNIAPFAKALQNIIAALKDEKVGGALQKSVNRIFDLFAGVQNVDFAAIFLTGAEALDKIVTGAEALVGAFANGGDGTKFLMQALGAMLSTITLIQASGIGGIFEIMGTTAKGALVVIESIGHAVEAITEKLSESAELLKFLSGGMLDVTSLLPAGTLAKGQGAGNAPTPGGPIDAFPALPKKDNQAPFDVVRPPAGAVNTNKNMQVTFGNINVGDGAAGGDGLSTATDLREQIRREVSSLFGDFMQH